MSPRAGWPADNCVEDVTEEPIEDYTEDQHGGETAQLTSAYPIQESCNFVAFHLPGSLHLRRMIGETSPQLHSKSRVATQSVKWPDNLNHGYHELYFVPLLQVNF